MLLCMLSCIYSEKQICTLFLSEAVCIIVHGRLLRYGQGLREMEEERETENCTTTMISQLNAECIQIICAKFMRSNAPCVGLCNEIYIHICKIVFDMPSCGCFQIFGR